MLDLDDKIVHAATGLRSTSEEYPGLGAALALAKAHINGKSAKSMCSVCE